MSARKSFNYDIIKLYDNGEGLNYWYDLDDEFNSLDICKDFYVKTVKADTDGNGNVYSVYEKDTNIKVGKIYTRVSNHDYSDIVEVVSA